MKSVLVTGGRGFIGRHLVRGLLDRGTKVRCLVRDKNDLQVLANLDVEVVEGDICSPSTLVSAVHGVDTVFHVAGITSALQPNEFTRNNVEGTANIAHACALQETPPVHVVMSSIAAAGPTSMGHERSEEELPSPISNYGRSKLAAEQVAVKWSANVPTTVIRPGMIFGEANREMLPLFYGIDRVHLFPHPNFSSLPLSILYVQDLVDLACAAATDGERVVHTEEGVFSYDTGYYFACANEHPTFTEWGQMIGKALDRTPVYPVPLPYPVPWILTGINEIVAKCVGRPNTLNPDKMREASAESWACSPRSAAERFHFDSHRPLLAQLRATVCWYREHQWL